MAYTPGGFPFDGSSLPGNLVAPASVDLATWNAFLAKMQQSGNAHVAADYHGARDMSGGLPDAAATGEARWTSNAGELVWSQHGRPFRRAFWDREVCEFGTGIGELTQNPSDATTNTAIVQAALTWGYNEVAAHRPARILFPPWDIPINGTLLWKGTGAACPSLIGVLWAQAFDLPASRLLWYGSANATMLYAESNNKSLLENLCFDGRSIAGKTVHYAASTYADPSILAASSGSRVRSCLFKHVKIQTVGNAAFALGTDTALTGGDTFEQADVRFDDCTFIGEDEGAVGFTYAGMQAAGVKMMSGGNCKLFSFNYAEFLRCGTAVDATNSSGPLNFLIASIGDCRCAFRHNSGSLNVIGGDMEGSHLSDFRLLVGTSNTGASAHFVGLELAAYMSGSVGTLIEGGGQVWLRGSYLYNNNYSVSANPLHPNPFKCITDATPASTDRGSFHSEGNWYVGCGFDRAFIPIYDGSANDLAPIANVYGGTVEIIASSRADRGGYPGADFPLGQFDSALERHYALQLAALNQAIRPTAATPVYEAQVRRANLKITLPYTAFQAAAVTKDISLGDFRAGTYLRKVRAEVTVAFAGTAGTLQLKCGIGAADGKVWPNADVKTAVITIGDATADYTTGPGMGDALSLGYCPDKVSTYTLSTRLTSGSGNLSGLNAGSVTFYLEYELP